MSPAQIASFKAKPPRGMMWILVRLLILL